MPSFSGDAKFASVVYRLFKLPPNAEKAACLTTYKGTVTENQKELNVITAVDVWFVFLLMFFTSVLNINNIALQAKTKFCLFAQRPISDCDVFYFQLWFGALEAHQHTLFRHLKKKSFSAEI